MHEAEKVLEMPGIEPGAFPMQIISQMRKTNRKRCGSVNFSFGFGSADQWF